MLNEYEQAGAVKLGCTTHLFSGTMISEKGNNRIIVVVFGGKNTKILNAQMIEVASLGFRK